MSASDVSRETSSELDADVVIADAVAGTWECVKCEQPIGEGQPYYDSGRELMHARPNPCASELDPADWVVGWDGGEPKHVEPQRHRLAWTSVGTRVEIYRDGGTDAEPLYQVRVYRDGHGPTGSYQALDQMTRYDLYAFTHCVYPFRASAAEASVHSGPIKRGPTS